MSLNLLNEQCGLFAGFEPCHFTWMTNSWGQGWPGKGQVLGTHLILSPVSLLGGEGSLWVNHFAFQWEDTLQEINSKFLIINLPDFLPKEFSEFPHSFHAILVSLGFSKAQTQPHSLISWNSFAGTGWEDEGCGLQDLCLCFSLWSSLLQRPLEQIRFFSIKFNGFWVRNQLIDVWALIPALLVSHITMV